MPDGIVYLQQKPKISAGATRNVSVDLSGVLDSGETISSVSSEPAESGSSDLTLGSAAINSSTLTILGHQVAANHAIQFLVSGQQAGTIYKIHFTIATSDGQTIPRGIYLICAP